MEQPITKSNKWAVPKIVLGVLILLSYLSRLLQGGVLFKSGGGSENFGYNTANVLLFILAIWLIVSGIRSKSSKNSSSKV